MSELRDKLLRHRQVLDCLKQADALLDRALDPATPRDEAKRDAAIAEALLDRVMMTADGGKPS